MEIFDLFQRLGLAIAIGAAVGVERHWRERDEPEGGRTAGIRTFTLIGMTGGLAGLIELAVKGEAFPGLVVTGFLLCVTAIILRFGVMEALAQKSFSATTVIAAVTTFGLGTLSVIGDMVLASAGGAAMVTVLASREFLHGAIRRLKWEELRSAVILLAMTFVLLPLIPAEPVGPFGGVSPRSLVVLVIALASISYVGYVAVRLLGQGQGDLVAGAVGGVVSSTGTTLALARRSLNAGSSAGLAAGALVAGAVSLVRTVFLMLALSPALGWSVVPGLGTAALVMVAAALFFVRWREPAGEGDLPANPFEIGSVIRMALLIAAVAFLARAASEAFGEGGLYLVSVLSAFADVDAATVTIAGMADRLSSAVAVEAIGLAVIANIVAKALYAAGTGSRSFAAKVAFGSLLAVCAGLAAHWAAGLL
ncbi:MgtC/SapB family protein [Rhizobium sp. SL42]|uniref:MgtC/SapB family protein n=1 Tax=Rhizobium sp. SL42 TaxID=2806346 RepID=UPI001F2C0A4D|nr:DUF4010 domain-containing protein [Rhizobium sp. SL42]UJW74603.1 DUF4010 domain-containing protein [Rhizobium sp. SL42]